MDKLDSLLLSEKIVGDAIKSAVKEKDASKSIEIFIEFIGKAIKSDKIYIFEGTQGVCVSNTYEWCNDGVSAKKGDLQNVLFEKVKWIYDIFKKKDYVIIKDIEDINGIYPLTYSYVKPRNINSIIIVPLILGEEIIGFLGVDNPPARLLENIDNLVELVANFVVSLIEKRMLLDILEKYGFRDSLTEVKNRHALRVDISMHEYVANVGILYCDVLGLKQTNDLYGHLEGDNLIIRVAKCLQDCFRKNDVYRVGGDEFLIVCIGIDEEVFESKIKRLRESMPDYTINLSIGSIWKEQTDNIDAMIAEADFKMYEEKRAYYLSNSENQ